MVACHAPQGVVYGNDSPPHITVSVAQGVEAVEAGRALLDLGVSALKPLSSLPLLHGAQGWERLGRDYLVLQLRTTTAFVLI